MRLQEKLFMCLELGVCLTRNAFGNSVRMSTFQFGNSPLYNSLWDEVHIVSTCYRLELNFITNAKRTQNFS